MKKVIGIYKLTSPSGKCYIGQSTNIYQRFRDHRRDKKYKHAKLYNAINKYGYDRFKKEIIEMCSMEELDTKETFWIRSYNSVDDGYNCDYGGQQHKVFSKEHRQKLREAFLGVYNGDQNIEFSINGVSYSSVGTASKQLGIPPKTIHNRLNSQNIKYSRYLYKDASLIPMRKPRKYKSKPFKIGDKIYNTLREASVIVGIPPVTLRRQIMNGKIPNASYI